MVELESWMRAARGEDVAPPPMSAVRDGLHAQALGHLQPVAGRRPHLPDEQRDGTGTAWGGDDGFIVPLLFKWLETLAVRSEQLDATRARSSLNGIDDQIRLQVGRSNLVGRSRHDLFSGQYLVLDQTRWMAWRVMPSAVAASLMVSHAPPLSAER